MSTEGRKPELGGISEARAYDDQLDVDENAGDIRKDPEASRFFGHDIYNG